MLYALTARQSRDAEARAVAELGVGLGELMERAGTAVADEVGERYPTGPVAVVTGPGNNGGDGWVAARVLHERRRDVRVLATRAPEKLEGDARQAAARALGAGVIWRPADRESLDKAFASVAVVVDALLGTGSRLPLTAEIARCCEAIGRSGAPVLAVDLPTGVDSDTGQADQAAVACDCTVTFIAPKLGLVTYPGAGLAGDLLLADLGVPATLARIDGAPEVWTDEEYAPLVPLPRPDAHKNDRGRVLVIAGSSRFPGAAVLAARGAMRCGAGYVTLAVPEPIVQLVQGHLLAVPVVGLPASRSRSFATSAGAAALELAAGYDAVVIGPGLTLADGAVATARELVARLDAPLVVDADALNALVDAHELMEERRAPTVLTPHPGELARLLGVSASAVQADRVSSSARLAGSNRAVVLKGAGTVVSLGDRSVIVTAGSPALATAGTGDVLSGMIGALMAQGLDPLAAGALGAHLHGRAGEAAAEAMTPVCVTAEDVPEYLPAAVKDLLVDAD